MDKVIPNPSFSGKVTRLWKLMQFAEVTCHQGTAVAEGPVHTCPQVE